MYLWSTCRPLPDSSSKAGLINLTKALAVEWARYGINVNAIAPSFVSSRLTRVILEDLKSREYVLSRTPLRRLAQPEDLLGALIFLASSASDYVTGQVIAVDGGVVCLVRYSSIV
ncbi:MAG: SDR family oxidoreductase [Thaumarchaeota archaeon]|nr:SDR family oxidoreductase [Nitrososphaerota archaeon]